MGWPVILSSLSLSAHFYFSFLFHFTSRAVAELKYMSADNVRVIVELFHDNNPSGKQNGSATAKVPSHWSIASRYRRRIVFLFVIRKVADSSTEYLSRVIVKKLQSEGL